jgi:hypothetical protein
MRIFVCKLRLHIPDRKHLRGFACHEIFGNFFRSYGAEGNVTPVPKGKLVRDINKHLRPISLTPAISKIERYVAPAILEVIAITTNLAAFGVPQQHMLLLA